MDRCVCYCYHWFSFTALKQRKHQSNHRSTFNTACKCDNARRSLFFKTKCFGALCCMYQHNIRTHLHWLCWLHEKYLELYIIFIKQYLNHCISLNSESRGMPYVSLIVCGNKHEPNINNAGTKWCFLPLIIGWKFWLVSKHLLKFLYKQQ